MKHSTRKTKGYYVLDTFTNRMLWKHMTNEELVQVKRDKAKSLDIKRNSKGKIKRRIYSQDTRKFIQ